MDRLYVSGLWLIQNNVKRSPDHYFQNLPGTFSLIKGQRLVFHYDDESVINEVSRLAREFQITLEPVKINIQELECWVWASRFVDGCQAMRLNELRFLDDHAGEKGVAHFRRDLQKGGKSSYERMLTIWLSKVSIVTGLANNSSDRSIAWIDASIARFNHDRENWDFTKLKSVPGCISHYGNRMSFYGKRLPLNAAYLEGNCKAWNTLYSLYNEILPKAARMPYGHDEETVLSECVTRSPELFNCLGQPFHHQKGLLERIIRKSYDMISAYK
jgi:hypothetical protein